ncbi:MAG: chemotaxis protein CheW [Myxococcota bacterium]
MIRAGAASLLLVRAHQLTCALPLGSVSEVMRPLPLQLLAGLPPYVRGVSMIRGRATPVVDLSVLLGHELLSALGRYVVVKASSRVALAVSAVERVWVPRSRQFSELPRLLADAGSQHIRSLESLDGELVSVLASTVVLPEEVWQQVAGSEAARAEAQTT